MTATHLAPPHGARWTSRLFRAVSGTGAVIQGLYGTLRASSRPVGRGVWSFIDRHGLVVGGVLCFVAAAWMIAVPFGLVIAGLGMWFLQARRAERP